MTISEYEFFGVTQSHERLEMTVTKSDVKSGNRVTILECPSCGGKHESVEVGEFAKQYGPYTHYFTCPNTQDPAFISLATYNGTEIAEVSEVLCRNMLVAQKADKWLNATFRIVNGEIFLDRVTHNFPTSDFALCVKLLDENLKGETQSQMQPAAMTKATPQSPIINLFGKSPINADEDQVDDKKGDDHVVWSARDN